MVKHFEKGLCKIIGVFFLIHELHTSTLNKVCVGIGGSLSLFYLGALLHYLHYTGQVSKVSPSLRVLLCVIHNMANIDEAQRAGAC